MVNQHDPPLDQFDLFKRKHSRQNKDFVRAHTIQAQRIRTLETENRRLLDENLAFRTENVGLKCQLARQASLVDSARNTQQALEKILNDIMGVKNGLEDSLQNVRPGGNVDLSNVSSRGVRKTVKARRKTELQVDELTELNFDEFKEERKNKQKALMSGLEAPFSESPRVVSETDASDSEEDLETDDLVMSEPTRTPAIAPPSRRHSLSIPSNLNISTDKTTSTIKRTSLKNPAGREKPAPPPAAQQPLESTPPPDKENPRKRRRSEMFTSSSTSNKENLNILPPPLQGSELFSPQRISNGNYNDKAQRGVLSESSPTRPSIIIPAGLTTLESPNKMTTPLKLSNTVGDNGGRVSDKAMEEFLMGLDEEGGGRRTSRARRQVNYALPNLRDKMRREDNTLVEKGRQRSRSMDRSVTPDMEVVTLEEISTRPPIKEIIVKAEQEPTPVRMPISKPTPAPTQSVKPAQPSQKPLSSQPEKKSANVKPRLSLIERQTMANTSSTTSRQSNEPSKKRRISSLHAPILPPKSTTTASSLASSDLFRFPSESPPKQAQSTKPPPSQRTAAPPPVSRSSLVYESDSSDKENGAPLTSWPIVVGGRERRKTFTATMEKMARMNQEEMQFDKEWEATLAHKRRRQSVAL